MADDFDWTKGEPQGESVPLDVVLPSGYTDGKSGDDIDREAQRKEVPVGNQLFFITDIGVDRTEDGQPAEKQFRVWLDGRENAYYAYNLIVTAAWAEDPEVTIKIFLRTPPVNPAELRAYAEGMRAPEENQDKSTFKPSKQSAGWHWKYLKHFIHHLGFDMNPDGTLPAEAQLPGNWKRWPDGKPRYFVAEIVPGRGPREDPENKAGKKLYNQLSMHPFSDSEDTIRRRVAMRNGQGYAQAQTQPRQPQTQPQSQKPQTRPQQATQVRGGSGVSGGIAESDIPEI